VKSISTPRRKTEMAMSDALIGELTQEAATTRRVLERVPEEKLSWAPHPKSMSLGQLALHIAVVPGAVAELVSELTREVPAFDERPEASSRAELLRALEDSIALAKAKLSAWSDDELRAEWKMVRGEDIVMAVPRIGIVRSVMLNHWYHHRGELLVYLRLLDVPVPWVYGPSADESPFD
jgi:uncharacterized damage-inducible protein DinB